MPRAYTGRYPIRTHRTMAQVMADEGDDSPASPDCRRMLADSDASGGFSFAPFHPSTHSPGEQYDHG